MTIGERIKEKRLEKRMSLEKLANAASVARQTIYKYENNLITNIPTDKIEAIAKVLNVSPGFLMGWEQNDDYVAFFSNELGEKVKKLRGQLSQKAFADKCDIDTIDLHEIETGSDILGLPLNKSDILLKNLMKIANYTNTDYKELTLLLQDDINFNLAQLPNNKFYELLSFCRYNEKEAYSLIDYVNLNPSDRKSVNDLIEMLTKKEMENE